ncbi:MAG: DUF1232 domain-containing protein [Candidatus Hydrogenedens sp.]|nr:DUF1232 domain-containing protein [Candidatus Hydrogenedens sp.]
MSTEEPDVDASVLRRKLRSVPGSIVQKALTLYVILTDGGTPAWVRALVLAALAYLINPMDACPDALPGIGLTDDLVVLALALERLSNYVTAPVTRRVRELTPEWLADGAPADNPQPKTKKRSKKKGTGHAPEEEDG